MRELKGCIGLEDGLGSLSMVFSDGSRKKVHTLNHVGFQLHKLFADGWMIFFDEKYHFYYENKDEILDWCRKNLRGYGNPSFFCYDEGYYAIRDAVDAIYFKLRWF